MISDSPYQAGDEILKPWVGALAGLLAAGIFYIFLLVLQPIAKFSLDEFVLSLGNVFAKQDANLAKWLGLVVFELVGAFCGMMYAISQRTIPTGALFIVGASYGIFLWVMANLLGLIIKGDFRLTVRSWQWLVGSLLFTLVLVVIAVLVKKLGHAQQEIAPTH